MLRRLKLKLHALLHKREMESELDRELRFHLDKEIEKNLQGGMRLEEARAAALRSFGGVERVKEETRDVRGLRRVEMVWQDLRYGLRVLKKNPGFAAVAILTLALGIGANTAIFSVINAVLLRPLPYDQPGRLVAVLDSLPTVGFPRTGLSQMEYIRLRQESRSFEGLSVATLRGVTLTGGGEAELLTACIVSSNFFDTLHVKPALGRFFEPEEDLAGKSSVVVLSQGFWQRRFDSSVQAIGESIALNGNTFTVIGVLPPDFKSPLELQFGTSVEVWQPIGFTLTNLERGSHSLNAVGRLAPGATIQQARAESGMILGRVVSENPGYYPTGDGSVSTMVEPLQVTLVGDVRTALIVLLCAVISVLLIACANIANILLVRGEARQKEIALRTALGANQGQIIRQLLTESMMLSVAGGTAGLLLARWGLGAIIAINPGNIPRLAEISLDKTVLLFTVAVSLLAGIIFGIAPAVHSVKRDFHSALKEGGRGAGVTGGSRLRRALVVIETATAMLLLVGAGLLARSFWQLRRVQAGFEPSSLLTLRLSPPSSAYQDNRQITSLYEQLVERVQALPGVTAAGVADAIPISGNDDDTVVEHDDQQLELSSPDVSVTFRIVNPGYFRAMGLRLISGRLPAESDREGTLLVAAVNEKMARTQWPGENALGKRFRLLDAAPGQATTAYLTVVGIVGDAKNQALDEDPRQEAYVPLPQQAAAVGGIGPSRSLTMVIRTAVEPTSLISQVRQEVSSVDRNIPITRVRTMEQVLEAAVVQPRFNVILLVVFGVIALCLGAIGIYGVIAYTVAQRTHEIGARMALGATRGDVLKLVIRQGMELAVAGVAIGTAAALGLTRLMTGLLYGVGPTDPLTFAAIAVLLVLVAFVACFVPARRATKVDPIIALRYE